MRREEDERLLDALAIADEAGFRKIRWQARMELGQLYRERQPERADGYFSESLDVIETRRPGALLDDLNPANLAVSLAFYDPYDLYIGFLLDQGRRGRGARSWPRPSGGTKSG